MTYNESEIEELNQVCSDLRNGKTATPVTIRNFLWWFDTQRRTPARVQYIDEELARLGIRTVPNYHEIWVETPITFELIAEHKEEEKAHEYTKNEDESYPKDEEITERTAADPSFRIGKIPSANIPPIFVSPNANLAEAITLMLARNFSQLPVMTNERDVKGVISWASIGARSLGSNKNPLVQNFMDEHYEISLSASLFSGIRIILEHNYVLIRAPDRKICGIVTSNDIAFQFEEISTPFLLISEVENSLRHIISKKLTVEDITASCNPEFLPKEFSDVSELSFGNYVKILENPVNWAKIGLSLERNVFCSELMAINVIRNDVMHFDPDPLKVEDLEKLRNVSKLLNRLREISAY